VRDTMHERIRSTVVNIIKYYFTFTVICCTIGHEHDKNVGLERDLSMKHLQACIYAGVKVSGCIRENGPSQVWTVAGQPTYTI
jgi:translation initiation factor 2 beta subunit (eIF-2beta)/eIF-5